MLQCSCLWEITQNKILLSTYYYYANLVVHEVDHEGSVDLIRKIKEVYKSLNEIASDQNTNRKYICSTVSIQSYSSNYSSSKSKYTQITLFKTENTCLPSICIENCSIF